MLIGAYLFVVVELLREDGVVVAEEARVLVDEAALRLLREVEVRVAGAEGAEFDELALGLELFDVFDVAAREDLGRFAQLVGREGELLPLRFELAEQEVLAHLRVDEALPAEAALLPQHLEVVQRLVPLLVGLWGG